MMSFLTTGSSTGTTSTSTIPFSHNNSNHSGGNSSNSNNNNMNSSNLNLSATHNGFGLNHNASNPTHSNHFNSTSVLTYRSNRRSTDRMHCSDNKIGDTLSPTSSTTSTRNDPIQEGITSPRSYLNMCLRMIHKTLTFLCYSFSKRRSTNLNNSNNKSAGDSTLSRFISMLKYRAIGGNNDAADNYTRNILNESFNEQTTYIERIDADEHIVNSDLSVQNSIAGKVTTSFTPTAPITIELPPTGIFFNNLI